MSSLITLPSYPFPQSLAASLALLILSEYTAFYPGSALFKTAASLSFFLGGWNKASGVNEIQKLLLALDFKALWVDESLRYTASMLLGLGFSVLGDVLLIPSKTNFYSFRQASKKVKEDDTKPSPSSKAEGVTLAFKLGTLSFALAHISYVVAFMASPTPLTTPRASLGSRMRGSVPLVTIPKDIEVLVQGYVGIITTMVAVATATDPGVQKVVGAWMFMISDLFVAIDTFGRKKAGTAMGVKKSGGKPGWAFRSVGWIFYFGANLILAGAL
ncbi:YhhN domain-containing protein [Ephemerocybe angulata]|uniref:YhhN domain-containing protein n=1 Tax=Ephemerocybe angulata TaxID=980116 RepID=A0A8H6I322_9AGAR|nr:YhhN domain-containing protein [Tulosesus angulatus]